jgi:hypothetical protein
MNVTSLRKSNYNYIFYTPREIMENGQLVLRRLKEKRARYVSHEHFLNQCVTHSKIPVGFTFKWKAELDIDNDTMEKCKKIKCDASIKLMEATREACVHKISDLSDQITQQEALVDDDAIRDTDVWEMCEGARVQSVKDNKWRRLEGGRYPGYRDVRLGPVRERQAAGIDWFENSVPAEPDVTHHVDHETDNAGCSVLHIHGLDASNVRRTGFENGRRPLHKNQRPVLINTIGQEPETSNEAVSKSNSNDDIVTNLSKYTLTSSETSLLGKGLKFIPDRTRIDPIKLLADLDEWERRMRLREFFQDKDTQGRRNEYEDKDKFTVKRESHFTPIKGRDSWLDLYIQLVKNDVVNSLKKACKLNVTKEEKVALMSLLHNEDIIIRPCDKGSGIVVVDKADYIDKLYRELDDSASYMETDDDRTDASLKAVKKLVNRMQKDGAITKELHQYLIPRYPTAGKLKGNPKLHKPGAPFRVIVSGMSTATERLAEVSEYELKEFVVQSPSYIRDTTDFIKKLESVARPVPEGAILFCFDVCKLYPSIPRKEGVAACKEALEARADPLVPTKYALEMIETVLDNNNFSMGDKHFVQTDGVAIGSRLGCNFACSYMRKWDEELLKFHKVPSFYKRYIDDGFGIWLHGLDSLNQFTSHANNIHDNIKVELRWSTEKVEFLDTSVVMNNGAIYTDLYTKPTDKQLYINNSSCHPAHTKKGRAYGLGLRLKRICQREEDYKKRRGDLKTQLRKRGYSGAHIETQLRRVDAADRGNLLIDTKKKTANERVPLVVTYSKLLPDIRSVLTKHEATLYRSDRMREVFPSPPMLAYRRDQNISDLLVHSKTSAALKSTSTSCSCVTCNSVYSGPIANTAGNTTHTVVQKVDCTTRNVVYGLRCGRCKVMIYIGETERTINERFMEHRRDVRQQSAKPINRHCVGHTAADLQVVILRKLFQETKRYRVLCEEEWIRVLGTTVPDGCNVKHNL